MSSDAVTKIAGLAATLSALEGQIHALEGTYLLEGTEGDSLLPLMPSHLKRGSRTSAPRHLRVFSLASTSSPLGAAPWPQAVSSTAALAAALHPQHAGVERPDTGAAAARPAKAARLG